MYDRLISDMDINAGAMLTEGQSLEEKGREIYNMLLTVASGTPSKSEAQGPVTMNLSLGRLAPRCSCNLMVQDERAA